MIDKENSPKRREFPISEEIQLERNLLSSEGDETLEQLRYFLHGTSSMIDVRGIEEGGLRIPEGRATLSTDLAHSVAWATGKKLQFSESRTATNEDTEGRIFVFRKPDGLKIDYGLFTDAVVSEHRVTGFPLKYASGRKQLALYKPKSIRHDLEKLRKEERDVVTLPSENIEAVIRPSEEIYGLVAELSQKTKRFEKIDIKKYAARLTKLLSNDNKNTIKGDVLKICIDIVTSTVESITISKIRNLSLDVLASQGYEIVDNNEPQTRQRNIQSLQTEIQTLYEQCHQDNFDIGIDWLNIFTIKETKRLRDEMNLTQ